MSLVLVVEDNRDSRDALCGYLSKAGYRVDGCENGKQALLRMLARTPDLVILDLAMPEMDGIALLEVIRSYRRLQAVPVIVLTGHVDHPAFEIIPDLKVSAVLVKARTSLKDTLYAVREHLPLPPAGRWHAGGDVDPYSS